MRVVVGQSAKRFLSEASSKPLVLAGVMWPDHEGLMDITDGDVVVQSILQAIGSIVGYRKIAQLTEDLLEKDGITDSLVYLEKALPLLGSNKIIQVSLSLELKRPLLTDMLETMQQNLAKLLHMSVTHIGISFFESSGLSDISCGVGIGCLCMMTLSD